jgi:hypothetical protein
MFYSFVFWPLIRIPPLNHSLTLYSDAISHEIILLPVRKKNIFAIGILWFLSTFSHLKSLSISISFATGTIFRTVPSTGKPLQMPALQVCICWTKHWFSSYTPSPFSCKVISFFMNFFFNVPIIFVFLSCWSGSLYDKRPKDSPGLHFFEHFFYNVFALQGSILNYMCVGSGSGLRFLK